MITRTTKVLAGTIVFSAVTALHGAELPEPLNPHDASCPTDGKLLVNTALSQTTEIDVPKGQYVYDLKGGDTNNWDISVAADSNAKEPPRSIGVMPKVKGATTMIYLTTNTLQQCVIRLQEISGRERSFDTLIRLQRGDGQKETRLPELKWVPAYQVQDALSKRKKHTNKRSGTHRCCETDQRRHRRISSQSTLRHQAPLRL